MGEARTIMWTTKDYIKSFDCHDSQIGKTKFWCAAKKDKWRRGLSAGDGLRSKEPESGSVVDRNEVAVRESCRRECK